MLVANWEREYDDAIYYPQNASFVHSEKFRASRTDDRRGAKYLKESKNQISNYVGMIDENGN